MQFYAISYMWYAVIGTILCIFVGVIVGLITGNENDIFDEKLLHPLIAKISRRIPGKQRTFSLENEKKLPEEKDPSEKSDNTLVEDIKPSIFTTSNSNKLFDSCELNQSPLPSRTRL